MTDEIYLEPDEEVTSAIDKVKKSKKKQIILNLPRNAILGQSVVNLKLVYKEATAAGKSVALVCGDKITRSLAERVGFEVFENANQVTFPEIKEPPKKVAKKIADPDEETEIVAADESKTLERQRFDGKPVAQVALEEEEGPSAMPGSTDDTGAASDEEPLIEPASDDNAAVDEPKRETRPYSNRNAGGGMIPTRGNLKFMRSQQKKKRWLWPTVIVGAIILITAIVFAIVYPSATVKLTVMADPLTTTANVIVDTTATSINNDTSTLPGKVISVDNVVTKSSASATGSKDIGSQATGTVVIYNSWDSQSHSFPAGTTITDAAGHQFTLNDAVTVGGATSVVTGGVSPITPGKSASVGVTATAPGTSSNVAPTNFTITSLSATQQKKIYASSSAAFTGGTSNVVPVVTQQDIDTLTAAVKTQNQTDINSALKTKAGTQVFVDKAVNVTSQTAISSVSAGTQASSVEVTTTGKGQVIAFSQTDYNTLVGKLLNNQIPAGQMLVTDDTGLKTDMSQFILNQATDTQLQLTANIKAYTVPEFQRSAVLRALDGATKSSVNNRVSNVINVTSSTVVMKPSKWPLLPLLTSRINLQITYTQKSSS